MSSITQYKTKSGKTFYRVQYTIGVDPLTGKQKRTQKRGLKTQRDAKLFLAKQMVEIDNHGFAENQNIKYQAVYDYFMKSYKNTVKESTLNRVEGLFKYHILPLLGNKSIKKITIPMCQEMVNKWATDLVDFRKVVNYAGKVFKEARRLRIIYDNPMELVIIPKDKAERHKLGDDKFWDKDELNLFLKKSYETYAGRNNKAVALFRLLAFTGARKGEILALQIADFDYNDKTILINKTVTRAIDNKQSIGTPKTISGYRTLGLDQTTANILNDWIDELHTSLKQSNINISDDEQLIFPNSKNKLLSLMKPNKWMGHIIDTYNKHCESDSKLKRITPHGIRHTWATIALESKNLTLKQVQSQLGDSDVNVILNTYVHVTKHATKETIDSFTSYLNSEKSEPQSEPRGNNAKK